MRGNHAKVKWQWVFIRWVHQVSFQIIFVLVLRHYICGKPAPFGTSGFGRALVESSISQACLFRATRHFSRSFFVSSSSFFALSVLGVNVSWLPISTGTLIMTYICSMLHAVSWSNHVHCWHRLVTGIERQMVLRQNCEDLKLDYQIKPHERIKDVYQTNIHPAWLCPRTI